MIVPSYWSEAKQTLRKNGRQQTIYRMGWSDVSEEDAHAHAQERLAEAVEQWQAGDSVITREYKRAYGEGGLPIREEIVEKTDDYVITRNCYGALCLNVEDICFIDIDIDKIYELEHINRWRLPVSILWVLTTLCLCLFFSKFFAVAIVVFMAIHFTVFNGLIQRAKKRQEPLIAGMIKQKMSNLVTAQPKLILRLYETPHGFRVLLMSDLYNADDESVSMLFNELKADPMYVRMCCLQQCFRARISPKPWRIGIENRIKPSSATFPYKSEWTSARQKWVQDYDEKSIDFASCKFLQEYGAGEQHPKAVIIRDIHDKYCRANEALPLA